MVTGLEPDRVHQRAVRYFDIWLVNADDPTDLRNVTKTPTVAEDQPSWSPDGTQIIFRSSASGAYEFYSLPVPAPAGATAAGGAAKRPTLAQLTFDGIPKQQPDWGPLAGSRAGTAQGAFCHGGVREGRLVAFETAAASVDSRGE